MAKLRHIALQVPDLEKAAAFYERALELTRVATAESPVGNAIMLSDGVMNLTLLHFPDGKGGWKAALAPMAQKSQPDWSRLEDQHCKRLLVQNLNKDSQKGQWTRESRSRQE